MPPQEAQGAFTDTLDRRFRDFDASFQTKLLEAMRWEDKVLHQYIEKHRLAEWVRTTFSTAQKDVEIQLDEATKLGFGDAPATLFGTTANITRRAMSISSQQGHP